MRRSLPIGGPRWLYLCAREHWLLQVDTMSVDKVDGHHEGEPSVSLDFLSPSTITVISLTLFSFSFLL